MDLQLCKFSSLQEELKELYLKEYKLSLDESANFYLIVNPCSNDSNDSISAIVKLASKSYCAVILLEMSHIHNEYYRNDTFNKYKDLLEQYNFHYIDTSSVKLKTTTYLFGMLSSGLTL